MAKPVTDDERAEIAELIQTGKSYTEVARLAGRSTGLVAKIAKEIGWTGDQSRRARTREANVNRSAYCAERRAQIAARLTEKAERLLEDMEKPHLVFNFGGKDNDYNERTLDKPPVESTRAMVQSVRDLLRTVIDIDRHDNKADDGLAAVDQWIRGLIGDEAAA